MSGQLTLLKSTESFHAGRISLGIGVQVITKAAVLSITGHKQIGRAGAFVGLACHDEGSQISA